MWVRACPEGCWGSLHLSLAQWGPFQHPSVIQILGHFLWGFLATLSHKTCLIAALQRAGQLGLVWGALRAQPPDPRLHTWGSLRSSQEQSQLRAPWQPCVVQRAPPSCGEEPRLTSQDFRTVVATGKGHRNARVAPPQVCGKGTR